MVADMCLNSRKTMPIISALAGVALIPSFLMGFPMDIRPSVRDTIAWHEVAIGEGLISAGKFPAA